MIAVGIGVYVTELVVTKDDMLWEGIEIVKKKLKKA